MSASPQAFDRLGAGAFLDGDVARKGLARIEAGGKRLGVMARRVDRGLEVEPVMDVGEEGVQRPLVLLVAAGCADRETRLAAAGGQRRRERGPRTFAGRDRVRQALLEPEHLRPRPETEAE